MFYVYVIESLKNEELYTVYTSDLVRRLKEHNQKLNFSTKRYVPWRIIYYKGCLNEIDARRREKYLKTSGGIRLVKRRLKEYFYGKQKI